MTVVGASIDNIVAGDKYQVDHPITNVPAGQLLTKAWFTVKLTATEDDPGVIQKILSMTNQPGVGQITDTGASGTGQVRVDLTKDDTKLLTPGVRYFFDIQVLTDAADPGPTTTVLGRLQALQGVTEADA